nr:MAG TPA: hypothetical protein [Caudoviricetes sp.]
MDKRINNIIDLVAKLIKNVKLYKSNSCFTYRSKNDSMKDVLSIYTPEGV